MNAIGGGESVFLRINQDTLTCFGLSDLKRSAYLLYSGFALRVF